VLDTVAGEVSGVSAGRGPIPAMRRFLVSRVFPGRGRPRLLPRGSQNFFHELDGKFMVRRQSAVLAAAGSELDAFCGGGQPDMIYSTHGVLCYSPAWAPPSSEGACVSAGLSQGQDYTLMLEG
jgi:hypothetical protein